MVIATFKNTQTNSSVSETRNINNENKSWIQARSSAAILINHDTYLLKGMQ
jgi:hypothetical protein